MKLKAEYIDAIIEGIDPQLHISLLYSLQREMESVYGVELDPFGKIQKALDPLVVFDKSKALTILQQLKI